MGSNDCSLQTAGRLSLEMLLLKNTCGRSAFDISELYVAHSHRYNDLNDLIDLAQNRHLPMQCTLATRIALPTFLRGPLIIANYVLYREPVHLHELVEGHHLQNHDHQQREQRRARQTALFHLSSSPWRECPSQTCSWKQSPFYATYQSYPLSLSPLHGIVEMCVLVSPEQQIVLWKKTQDQVFRTSTFVSI